MKKLIYTMVLAASVFVGSLYSQKFNIGTRTLEYYDSERERPIVIQVWYATDDSSLNNTNQNPNAIFISGSAIVDASIKRTEYKRPLLLLSHGTGGNRFSLKWLAEAFVQEGYIVASLDHYGNSTFNKIPREFVKWWERAIDIKFLITQLLEKSEFSNMIDDTKIASAGFSLGGYTNIALAGGYVDRDHFIMMDEAGNTDGSTDLPPEFPETDEEIDLGTDSEIVSSFERYSAEVKDERIKAFFVMAPAIGYGFHSPEQTKMIAAPLFILASESDTICPIKNNALNYHKLIPHSQIKIFPGKAGHYIFLGMPTEHGRQVAPQICVDDESVSRQELIDKTIQLAITFFRNNL